MSASQTYGSGISLSLQQIIDRQHLLGSVSEENRNHAYLKATLSNLFLTDVFMIRTFINIQTLDVSGNMIVTLEPLGNLIMLKRLNASRNRLTVALDFSPLQKLQVVDLSHNLVENLERCKLNPYLRELYLQDNRLTCITKAFEYNIYLRVLDLSSNGVTDLDCFSETAFCLLETLNVANNKLNHMRDIGSLKYLRYFNAQNNCIISLQFSYKFYKNLHTLILGCNPIDFIYQLDSLRNLDMLRILDLSCCGVQRTPFYRITAIHLLNKLKVLDNKKVTLQEKVSVEIAYGNEVSMQQEIWELHLPKADFNDRRIITKEKIEAAQAIYFYRKALHP